MKRIRDPAIPAGWPTLSQPGTLATLANGHECIEWQLPHGTLWWAPWPDQLEEPPLADGGHYRQCATPGGPKEMPRRTWCYGHSYAFSGQRHPVEAETPPQVSALYAWAGEACGPSPTGGAFNMDLCNYYPTGYHYISAHSDDERQFGSVHDVICFVTGPAARRIIIRDKASKRILLEGHLPAGVYCMVGRAFQKHYTHEFPRIHNALFERVLKGGPTWFGKAWPAQGASKRELAEWLAAGGEERKQVVLAHLPKQSDRAKWSEWLLPRVSHTLRNFE